MKALDIVATPKGGMGIIRETTNGGKAAAITYFNGCNKEHEPNAWWDERELTVLDSIPRVIAECMVHPFGSGMQDVNALFPLE